MNDLTNKFSEIILLDKIKSNNKEYEYQAKEIGILFKINIREYKHVSDAFNANSGKHAELAMVGDAYLDLVCAKTLFGLGVNKGDMDKFRQTNLNNRKLSEICDALFGNKIQKILVAQSPIYSERMKATFMEAWIGMLHLNDEPELPRIMSIIVGYFKF